ncbi:MAG: dicarboxylate/amino acid:cation symporter, partial [Anaerolineales bacterium]
MQLDKGETAQAGKILLGLLAGAATGVACHALFAPSPVLEWTVTKITQPVGQMWLRALIMIVLPLVFASLTLGVAGLGDVRKLGRIGLKTVAYFLITTALAACIGLTLVNTLRPGDGLSPQTRTELLERF